MKRLLLLLLAVAAASAAADGFFDPPPPPPERVAELDALCARLEALGMPAVPPDADWVFCGESGMWPSDATTFPDGDRASIPFFGSADATIAGNAWRWRPAPDAPACVLSVYGDLFAASPGFQPEQLPLARLGRATAGLRAALADNPPDPATTTPGPAVLFCAQLHRHGETARAAALLGLLGGAEPSATGALGRAQFAALLRSPARTNDLPAFAAALEENLARFPDAYATDPRTGLLAGIRGRVAAAGKPVPGVPADLQELVRALDRATKTDGDPDAFGPAGEDFDYERLLDIPWLLPEAWTNALPVPSNAVWRVRALGPRALDLLLPLLDDPTMVDGQWYDSGCTSYRTWTRADAARSILSGLLPLAVEREAMGRATDAATRAALRALVAEADAEDRFLLYLLREADRTPWHVLSGWDGLLLAWLAERAAEGPLPKIEARLEKTIRDVPQLSFFCDAREAGPQRALVLALFYAAFRGEAGAPFRDRILAVLRDRAASWEPPSGRMPVRDVFGRPDGTVEFRYKNPDFARRRGRAWYAKWAEAFASVPSGPVDSAALADWLRCAALVGYDDEPLFRPGLAAVPPAPELLRALAAPFPKPSSLWTREEWAAADPFAKNGEDDGKEELDETPGEADDDEPGEADDDVVFFPEEYEYKDADTFFWYDPLGFGSTTHRTRPGEDAAENHDL